MAHTKVTKRHGFHVLQVKDKETGKYKQVFKSKQIKEVNRKRVELQNNTIKADEAVSQRTIVNTYEEFALDKIAMAEHPKSGMRRKSVSHYLKKIFAFSGKSVHKMTLSSFIIDHFFKIFHCLIYSLLCNSAETIATCLLLFI